MKVFSTIIILLLFSSIAFTQRGQIRGVVIDKETSLPIPFVSFKNEINYTVGITDIDGNFKFHLPIGENKICYTAMGYELDTITIVVKSEGNDTLNLTLLEKPVIISDTVPEIIEDDTPGNIAKGRKSKIPINILGETDIGRTGPGNGADAVKKITGINLVGGKFISVRGLSDRYSKTTLNNAEIPGLDPSRNAVQMDLFPASLISSVEVYKTASPNLPANFTGGLVNINTKEFPARFNLKYSVGFGFNPQSSLNNNFITQESCLSDAFGLGALSRQLPVYIKNTVLANWPNAFSSSEELNNLGKSINRNFDPIKKTSGLNSSYGFALGNSKELKFNENAKFGYLFTTTYSKKYSYYNNGIQGRYKLTGTVLADENLNAELNLNDTRGQESVLIGLLGNVSLKTNLKNKISFTVNRFQNGVNSARYLEGNNYADANDLFFQTRSIYYQQRALTNAQLKGEHYLTKKKDKLDKIKLSWISSYTNSYQETPDLKFFSNDYTIDGTDTLYDLQPALYSDPTIFSRILLESNINTKIDLEIPLKALAKVDEDNDTKFQVGLNHLHKNRSFNEHRFDFVQQSGANLSYNGSVTEYMSDENFDAGNYTDGFIFLENGTEKRNSYVGKENNISGYLMTELSFGKLDVVTGARIERHQITSQSLNPEEERGELLNTDILPSINTTYHFYYDKKTLRAFQLRTGYYKSLARPTFRELAPFASFDFVGGAVFVGNPDLQRTMVDNYDMRLEYYPSHEELISFGIFAKQFSNPIERAFNPEAANAEITWNNVEQANVFGAELEVRKKISANFNIGGNVTLVKSEVTIPEKEFEVMLAQNPNAVNTRQMFGQAPYIANVFLGYVNDTSGVTGNLNFGVSGKQISVVNIGATPNVYQNAMPDLGANISKKIGKNKQYTLRLSASNLLNPNNINTYSFKGQEYVYSSFQRGRTYSFKVSYNFVK